MDKETGKEPNDKMINEEHMDNSKIISNFNPISEREQQEPIMISHLSNLQNSACKNFKSGMRGEPANLYLNATPIKLFPNENIGSIISPYKENNPFPSNFNMQSPDISSMKNIGLISTEKKMINDKNFNSILQGKKIDFNDDYMFIENDQTRNQNIIINNINNQNINYKPKISLSNKKTINRAYISAQPLTPNNNNIVQKVKCTCTKTGCLKKYCYCFAKGIPCEDCECKNCQNRGKENNNDNINNINNNNSFEKPIIPVIQNHFNKNQRLICNCTKSNCKKKYCECFKQGFGCNPLCRCVECKNKNNIKNDNIKNNNNTIDINDFSGSFFQDNENINNDNNKIDYRLPCNFQTEAFGISVGKEQLKYDERIIDLNFGSDDIHLPNNYEINATPKFSKRKRTRGRNESANLRTCPTTNSASRRGRNLSSVNKNIQKKKLQLN